MISNKQIFPSFLNLPTKSSYILIFFLFFQFTFVFCWDSLILKLIYYFFLVNNHQIPGICLDTVANFDQFSRKISGIYSYSLSGQRQVNRAYHCSSICIQFLSVYFYIPSLRSLVYLISKSTFIFQVFDTIRY